MEPRAGPSGQGPPPPTPPAAPPRLPGLRGVERRARPRSPLLGRSRPRSGPATPPDLGLARRCARETRFCDTQSARTAARPSPGAARLGRSHAGRLRWRDWAKEIKNKTIFCRRRKSPPAEPSGKSPYPRASRTAPTFRACPAPGGGMEWGRGVRALGTGVFIRSFQSWDPRHAGPSSAHPPSPTLGSSLLHLNCLVPQSPGTPASDRTLSPTLPLPQLFFHLPTSHSPLPPVLFPSHDAPHLSSLTPRPFGGCPVPAAGPVSAGCGHWSGRAATGRPLPRHRLAICRF